MADKKEKATKKATKEDAKQKATLPPSGFKVAMHEIVRSKSALTALIIIIVILLFTFGGSLFLNRAQVTEMNIADSYYGWGEAGHLLGTDDGGRDILKLLIMGLMDVLPELKVMAYVLIGIIGIKLLLSIPAIDIEIPATWFGLIVLLAFIVTFIVHWARNKK